MRTSHPSTAELPLGTGTGPGSVADQAAKGKVKHSMSSRTFVGFGFGAIQAGLFLDEAQRSGRFSRLVVAEVVPETVATLRAAGGHYTVNVASAEGLARHEVTGVEILNPRDAADRGRLVAAIAEADEMATALPSVAFYGGDRPSDPVALIVEALQAKSGQPHPRRTLLYAAENHNHAADVLCRAIAGRLPDDRWRNHFAAVETVIGKMSGVVDDPAQIAGQDLAPVTPGAPRAFLVEAFNRILVGTPPWPDFARGIEVFAEKPDLLPFEEAKLHGHNATHALIGYRLALAGCRFMAEAEAHPGLLALARDAFIHESGAALCRKHAGLDPLFTEAGYAAYADDLLVRMMNPLLRDRVDRIVRDPARKLAWDDRLVGTMRLVLGQGIVPRHYAAGAAAALQVLARERGTAAASLLAPRELDTLWPGAPPAEREPVARLLMEALETTAS